MSKISGISAVFAQLRTQASKLSSAEKSLKNRASGSADSSASASETLPEAISRSLATIDKDWSFDDKVRRLVRAILAWEFGDDILDDPNFYPLLDKVISSINESDTLTRDFTLLFNQPSD